MNGSGIKVVQSIEEIDFTFEDYWRIKLNKKLARELLKRNLNSQRTLKRKKETYARDMKKGRWLVGTGECIAFDTDGVLGNGQHRLHGIILADTEVTMDIKTCAPKDAFKVYDSGIQRSETDALTILQVPYAKVVASISKMSQVLYNGSNNMGTHIGINVAPSRQEIVDFAVLNNDRMQELAKRFCVLSKKLEVNGMGPTGWFVCWWLTYCKDKERSEEFLALVENAEGTGAQLLSTIMERNEDGKPKAREWMVFKYIESFNATMLGGHYVLGKNGEEMIKGYKKLFTEYCDNMRVQDTIFEW